MTDRTTSRVPHLVLCCLNRIGVSISLNDRGDGLKLAPAEKLCPWNREILREWKPELVALLKSGEPIHEDDEIAEFLDQVIPKMLVNNVYEVRGRLPPS